MITHSHSQLQNILTKLLFKLWPIFKLSFISLRFFWELKMVNQCQCHRWWKPGVAWKCTNWYIVMKEQLKSWTKLKMIRWKINFKLSMINAGPWQVVEWIQLISTIDDGPENNEKNNVVKKVMKVCWKKLKLTTYHSRQRLIWLKIDFGCYPFNKHGHMYFMVSSKMTASSLQN